MTEKQLLELIQRGESQSVEFKTSLSLRKQIGKTISAFANTSGGTVLIGVSDNAVCKGVDIGKKTIEDLANWIKENTDPPIYPEIKVHKLNGKEIIKVLVKESDEKPAFFRTNAFQRVGKTNQRISASKIRELAKQERVKLHWDERICQKATLEDIDEKRVKWFLQKARDERQLEINPNTTLREALERLELSRNGQITNAALLLFGQNPQKFFLQAKLRCARYKGVTPITFIDLKVIAGNIIDQVEKAENFVLSHIKKAAKILGFKREEVWEYPPSALREAIVNAVCHRDYSYNSDITIGILDDRIEISNPGKLPEPLTPAMLKQKHKSIPRNPRIADAFFLIKNIEQWGEGTNKIVRWCTEQGLKEPDFEEIGGGFEVRFYAPENILSLIPEPTKVDLRKLGLNQRQIDALRMMVNEGRKFTAEVYAKTFEVSKKTAIRDFKKLRESNFVTKIGVKKGAFYVAYKHVFSSFLGTCL